MKYKIFIRTIAVILSVLMLCISLAACGEEEKLEFVPPPFDAGAVAGTPDIEKPEAIGYTELDAKAYKLSVCGLVKLEGNSADIYFTNPDTNDVWLKIRVLDKKGNILGETGLIRPGEYVKTITFDKKVPKVGDEITMKIMGYQPETYYSAGAVNLGTTIS